MQIKQMDAINLVDVTPNGIGLGYIDFLEDHQATLLIQ